MITINVTVKRSKLNGGNKSYMLLSSNKRSFSYFKFATSRYSWFGGV